jgi:CheY-like chemotaxis protein
MTKIQITKTSPMDRRAFVLNSEKFWETNMFKLLMVSPDKDSLSGLASALAEYEDVDLSWADSGERALDIASDTAVDLVITDEGLGDMTGLAFADRLLSVNPNTNCASVSRLSPENFHEVSEGLGLMAQLPVRPGKEDAEMLIECLRNLKSLMGDVKVYTVKDH